MPLNPVLGQIMPFAGSVIPKNWALCNGALLSIQQNQGLFSLLGTYYGGNGVTNFQLPDLRGRAIMGSTGNAGLYPVGMINGSPQATLNVQQIPSHNHLIQVSAAQGGGRGSVPPAGNVFATNTLPAANPTKIFATAGSGDTQLALATNLLNDGSNQAHNNMQPYLTISYLIALQGVYPSRN
ncbi:tail fiber protein [Bradyrhizobium sp. BR 10289]|uniref:phage tail protein n=1 Tax=Bradyrhizobium sp. BR 10289 TaxID=2749993 RepID=UPI001C64E295|nr:tail fiber protein [Bradyrhizobium sp. BR 10289]MBW7968510.1 tail fiber protein [Bradyrhizobium sp. BR 10289]